MTTTLTLLGGIFAVPYIVHAPLLFLRNRRAVLLWLDWIFPGVGVGVWSVVTALGYGPQSLSNLIEIPIIAAVSFVLYAGVLVLPGSHKIKLKIAAAILVFGVLLLRTFMPLIPE